MDWNRTRWPNFSEREFACQHSGACAMDADFLDALQNLRLLWGQPMHINSGYRAATHPVEAAKPRPGAHHLGIAADIRTEGDAAIRLIALAAASGFTGIGLAKNFIHLDLRTQKSGLPFATPLTFWTYD